ncbi:MAG: replication-relaxation family protein [Chloroflexota bacterium]
MLNLNPTAISNDRIITHQVQLSPEEMESQIHTLLQKGQITERDEKLLETLSELNVLSLDQVMRLFWHGRQTQSKTVYERMRKLNNTGLLSSPRSPRQDMTAWGLTAGKVYALGDLGRYWLGFVIDETYVPPYLKRNQVLHDLLVSEFYLQSLAATINRGKAWSLAWTGERGASFHKDENSPPIIAPDSLGILTQMTAEGEAKLPFFVEMDASREAHGRFSHDWGRKVVGYDRFYGGPWQQHPAPNTLAEFPAVLVITHGATRLLNLAKAIAEKRKKPIVYYLTQWQHWREVEDGFKAPIWAAISPEGEIIGYERAERLSLLPNE